MLRSMCMCAWASDPKAFQTSWPQSPFPGKGRRQIGHPKSGLQASHLFLAILEITDPGNLSRCISSKLVHGNTTLGRRASCPCHSRLRAVDDHIFGKSPRLHLRCRSPQPRLSLRRTECRARTPVPVDKRLSDSELACLHSHWSSGIESNDLLGKSGN